MNEFFLKFYGKYTWGSWQYALGTLADALFGRLALITD